MLHGSIAGFVNRATTEASCERGAASVSERVGNPRDSPLPDGSRLHARGSRCALVEPRAVSERRGQPTVTAPLP